MDEINNTVELCGTAAGAPVFSHGGRGENFYTFPLEVLRLSGTGDTVNVVVRERLLDQMPVDSAGRIALRGGLRSFNNRSGRGSRLVITVFAKQIWFTDEPERNDVYLAGTVCKPTVLRRTPMGRMICDIMLAVNRKYGRSDYLPCIAWGSLAQEASALQVGDCIRLRGRIQSRTYIKNEKDGPVEKTAFEVSIVTLE